MTPERWRQVEELYNAARDLAHTDRDRILREANPELRGEVESLLVLGSTATNLPRADTVTVAAIALGQQLGPYRIDALIGQGGMGQVFRATDTRLHRTVAIKTLPHEYVANAEVWLVMRTEPMDRISPWPPAKAFPLDSLGIFSPKKLC
jgi:serine/threonine protein kinase